MKNIWLLAIVFVTLRADAQPQTYPSSFTVAQDGTGNFRTIIVEDDDRVGWDNWRNPENEKTAYYAEYESKGPGAAAGQRVAWSRQLTAREARRYTVEGVLGEWVFLFSGKDRFRRGG
jgi:pectin methylesterase-like acyl-CoA thioesterase